MTRKIETVASTASTNADLKARVEAGNAPEGLWLRAEKQSGGIGRLGRKWESPEGNLYCSTIVNLGARDPAASSLSFVTSLAVFDAVKTCLPEADLILKWPNDVLLNGRKTCGILLEQVARSVVVGVGVNIAVAPKVQGRVVTSLHEAGANNILTAADFLDLLSRRFGQRLSDWRINGMQATLKEWQNWTHPIGTPLSASIDKDNRIHGEFAGLTDTGALRLKKPNGALVEIHAGDVDAA